jgi:hypothetical protein
MIYHSKSFYNMVEAHDENTTDTDLRNYICES